MFTVKSANNIVSFEVEKNFIEISSFRKEKYSSSLAFYQFYLLANSEKHINLTQRFTKFTLEKPLNKLYFSQNLLNYWVHTFFFLPEAVFHEMLR